MPIYTPRATIACPAFLKSQFAAGDASEYRCPHWDIYRRAAPRRDRILYTQDFYFEKSLANVNTR